MWKKLKNHNFVNCLIRLVFCRCLLKVDPILTLIPLFLKLPHFNTSYLKVCLFSSHFFLLFKFHKLCITWLPLIQTLQFDDTHVLKAVKYSWLLLLSRHLSIHPIGHSSLYFIVTNPSFSSDIWEWPLLNFGWLVHTNV